MVDAPRGTGFWMVTVASMSPLYRLEGRRLEGSLAEPTCNDTEVLESDDWATLHRHGEHLAEQGFTIWLYDHLHRPALPGTSTLRLIEQIRPTGRADGSAGSR